MMSAMIELEMHAMNKTSKAAAALSTLVLLALIGFAGYWLYRGSTALVVALLPSVGASVLFACATALVCVAILSRALARSRRADGALKRRKGQLYERVIRSDGPAPDPRLVGGILVYASKAVLQRYVELRVADDPEDRERAWHRLVMEIRKDLGHRDGIPGPTDALELLAGQGPEPGAQGRDEAGEPDSRAGEFRVMSR